MTPKTVRLLSGSRVADVLRRVALLADHDALPGTPARNSGNPHGLDTADKTSTVQTPLTIPSTRGWSASRPTARQKTELGHETATSLAECVRPDPLSRSTPERCRR